jgi:flagellar protein FliO/FliZ
MPASSGLTSLLWFIAILVLIPLALWALKRTPMGRVAQAGHLRQVATLALSPNQRLVTVEVGQGDDKRWLVLGVTGHSITTLHTLPPQPDLPASTGAGTPFGQLLGGLQGMNRGTGGSVDKP